MKTITKFSTALLLSALSANAAMAASATGTASAVVVSPISVVEATPLSFGTFTSTATGGTLTSGSTSTTGGIVFTTPGAAGLFKVTGIANTSYNISSDHTVTLSNGSQTMSAILAVPVASLLHADGSSAFSVAGTLSVNPNQPAGTYTGTYNVSVNY